MADVLNRETLELRRSVHTPDYDPAEWIVNPDLAAVADVPPRHWKIVGDLVMAADAQEQAAIDAAQQAQAAAAQTAAVQAQLGSTITRAIVEAFRSELNQLRSALRLPGRTAEELETEIAAQIALTPYP